MRCALFLSLLCALVAAPTRQTGFLRTDDFNGVIYLLHPASGRA